MKYYKIIGDNNKTPSGSPYPYRLGLNTLKHVGEEFNSKPECGPGGLYFTTIENIFMYSDYGDTVCEVSIPSDALMVRVQCCKFKTNKFIIEKMLPLSDRATWEYLADRGARISSALTWASGEGFLAVVEYLLELGARTVDNTWALTLASHRGYLGVVQCLLKAGADVHTDNDSALRLASYSGHLNVVRHLIEAGADVHANDDDALARASYYGHLDVVQYLIEVGADVRAKNNDALRKARAGGHMDVVQCLIDAGATLSLLNSLKIYLNEVLQNHWKKQQDTLRKPLSLSHRVEHAQTRRRNI